MEQVEIIGLIAGVIGVLGWYPQAKRIWIDKKADGVSVTSFTAIEISFPILENALDIADQRFIFLAFLNSNALPIIYYLIIQF